MGARLGELILDETGRAGEYFGLVEKRRAEKRRSTSGWIKLHNEGLYNL
jgi:hypothetical protein